MQIGDFVQVHLQDPREQWLGRLIELRDAGVVLRGIEIRLVEAYRYQFQRDVLEVFPQTLFLPMRRIERIYLDEQLGDVPSMVATILTSTGFASEDLFAPGWGNN